MASGYTETGPFFLKNTTGVYKALGGYTTASAAWDAATIAQGALAERKLKELKKAGAKKANEPEMTRVRDSEPIMQQVIIICHNCGQVVEVRDKKGVEQEEEVGQCKKCDSLPSAPKPPATHLAQQKELYTAECRWCEQDKFSCRCKFCTVGKYVERREERLITCPEHAGETLLARVQAEERGYLCAKCGLRGLECLCEDRVARDIPEQILHLTDDTAVGIRRLASSPDGVLIYERTVDGWKLLGDAPGPPTVDEDDEEYAEEE